MAWCPALPNQISRDDRLSMSRRQRVRHAPEKRRAERRDDHPEAKPIATDECREAGVGHAVGRLQPGPDRHMRTRPRDSAWDEPGSDAGHSEWARQEVLWISPQLVARAGRESDDDLLPADAIPVVGVAVSDIARASQCRSAQDGLEPCGPEAAGPGRRGWHGLD